MDSLIDQQNFCDRELSSKLVDSQIDSQTSRDRELLSDLMGSVIDPQTFVFRRSYRSSLTPRSTKKRLTIESSY